MPSLQTSLRRRPVAPSIVPCDARGRQERGQALVEFALVAMVMLSLLAGVFELGRALHASILVSQAAREGARVAMVETNNTTVQTVAQNAAKPLSGVTVGIARSASEATVTVTYRVTLAIPLLSHILGRSYLDVRSVMTSRLASGG